MKAAPSKTVSTCQGLNPGSPGADADGRGKFRKGSPSAQAAGEGILSPRPFTQKQSREFSVLNKQEKQTLVADVRGVAQKGLSAVVAEYRGLSAVKFDQLRAEARKQGVYLHVVKNTLARIAVEGTEFECLKPALVGPVVLGLSLEDPGAIGRVIKDFAKANEKLVVKAVAVGGKLYGADALERLASLPTEEQALSQLINSCQMLNPKKVTIIYHYQP